MNKTQHNASKGELLAWVNQMIMGWMERVNKIEELGNGTAYLFILNHLYPGSVKVERIVKNSANNHDILYNLKYLAQCF